MKFKIRIQIENWNIVIKYMTMKFKIRIQYDNWNNNLMKS